MEHSTPLIEDDEMPTLVPYRGEEDKSSARAHEPSGDKATSNLVDVWNWADDSPHDPEFDKLNLEDPIFKPSSPPNKEVTKDEQPPKQEEEEDPELDAEVQAFLDKFALKEVQFRQELRLRVILETDLPKDMQRAYLENREQAKLHNWFADILGKMPKPKS